MGVSTAIIRIRKFTAYMPAMATNPIPTVRCMRGITLPNVDASL